MRLHRFYINFPIAKGTVNLVEDAALAHQLRQVFRFQQGSKAIFFNGSGTDYECEIISMTKTDVSFKVAGETPVKPFSGMRVSLAVSLIKKDNFEWVIQKGTELGVVEFIPLVTERSEKKGFNVERAKKIMIEALEQSGRGDVPTIQEPQTLADFLSHEKRKLFFFHTTGERFELGALKDVSDAVACVGPEGGWSDSEVASFKEKGASAIKVNAPILRAETAAIAIASLFLLL
jgi:16S rRNA (uracil1498-N3)-methyltransferase